MVLIVIVSYRETISHPSESVLAFEQFAGPYAKRPRELLDRSQAHVSLAALSGAHVGPVQPREFSELLLGEVRLDPIGAKIRGK